MLVTSFRNSTRFRDANPRSKPHRKRSRFPAKKFLIRRYDDASPINQPTDSLAVAGSVLGAQCHPPFTPIFLPL
jgi:hypothetical protein